MSKLTWNNSDYDLWQYDIFDTEEECIQEAKECYGICPGEKIYIGTPVSYNEIPIDADDIVEIMKERAYDRCGECAEDWISFRNKEEEMAAYEMLTEKLHELINDWLDMFNNKPQFYTIENIYEVEVPE